MKAGLVVREIFPTVQGEGSKAGTPAVFVRLANCNLWSGREDGRATGRGECSVWCDTDFVGGTHYTVEEIVKAISRFTVAWPETLVVLSGGEPMLQLRKPIGVELVRAIKEIGAVVSIETNGTIASPLFDMFDHITLSPKAIKGSDGWDHILVRSGTDLKVIVPALWSLEALQMFSTWAFDYKFFQPKDIGDSGASSTPVAVEMAQKYGWRVSFQTHKFAGLQ